MFEKSRSWQRYGGKPTKIVRVHLGHVPQLEPRPEEDRSALRIALTVAVLFHVAFFVMQLPEMAARPTSLFVPTCPGPTSSFGPRTTQAPRACWRRSRRNSPKILTF